MIEFAGSSTIDSLVTTWAMSGVVECRRGNSLGSNTIMSCRWQYYHTLWYRYITLDKQIIRIDWQTRLLRMFRCTTKFQLTIDDGMQHPESQTRFPTQNHLHVNCEMNVEFITRFHKKNKIWASDRWWPLLLNFSKPTKSSLLPLNI